MIYIDLLILIWLFVRIVTSLMFVTEQLLREEMVSFEQNGSRGVKEFFTI